MTRFIIPVLLLSLSGCSPHVSPEQNAIMDTIERQISLPQGSSPLGSYARVYAPSSEDRVSAVYFRPNASFPSCSEARAGGPTNGQVALLCPPPDGIKAGERRWLTNSELFPVVCDAGCSFVDVEFDVRSKKVISARCQGSL